MGAGELQTAWKIEPTGHLLAGNAGEMIKWGANYDFPAIKSSGTGLELEIRRGDDSSGAVLLHRMEISPVAMTTPGSRIISESESGCCFTNAGSTMTAIFNLPAATTDNIGFHCWFAVEVFLAESMRIHPAEIATTIRVGGSITGAGGDLSSGSSGVTLHLICTGLNQWVALRHIGTWLT